MILFNGKEVKFMKEKKLSINAIRIIFLVPIFVMMIIFACVAAYVMHNAAKNSGWTVTQYSDLTGGQAGFYTLEDGAGHFLIVDGGWAGNEARVRDAIKMHNNHVDAWILTHPHQDHIGAFNAIYANPDGITIDRIYDSPVDYDVVKDRGEKWDDLAVFEEYRKLTKNADNVTHLNRGEELDLYGLHIKVYNAYDRYVLDNSNDITNDSSLVFKASYGSSSMIFCGDIKYQMEDILTELYGSELRCGCIQAGHHGNWSFSDEFYDNTGASTVFIDSPAWIMQDSQYPAYELAEHLKEKGVTVKDFTTTPNVYQLY